MKERNYFYLVASIFNTVVGLLGMWSFYSGRNDMFFRFVDFNKTNPLAHSYMNMLGLNVLMFGFAYFLIYRNEEKYKGMILLGLLGKLGIVAAIPALYLQNLATGLALSLAICDLIFCLVFFRDVRKHKMIFNF